LLSGKIICGECESHYQAMLRLPSKGHPNKLVNYRCARKNASIKCHNREISRDALEAFVLDRLSLVVFNDKLIPDIVAGYNQYHASQNKDYIHRMESHKSSLRKIGRELDNITRAIAETGSRTLYEKLKSLEADKLELEHQLYQVQKEMNAITITEDVIAAAFKTARQLFNDRSIPNLQEIVSAFVDKVTLYTDHVEISFNFGFKTDIFKNMLSKYLPEDEADNSPKKDYPPAALEQRVGTCGGEGSSPYVSNTPKVRGDIAIISVNRKKYIEKNPDWESVNNYIAKLA